MTLGEKQFEIGGVQFGLDSTIGLVDGGWSLGTPELQSQDAPNPNGDGVRFGKDRMGALVWSWSLFTNRATEEGAWATLNELDRVWNDPEVRLNPDAVVPLTYRVAGVERVVYGRPRRWTPTVDNRSLGGRIDVQCDFTIVHPLYFDTEEKHEGPWSIGAPLELDAGIPVPFIAPFISTAGETSRSTTLTIGGDVPTPVTLILTANGAPLFNPLVRVADYFTVAIKDTVQPGNPLTVDPRPWVRSIATQSGGTVRVAPRETRLVKVWLPPGQHEVIFTGEDISSTATLMINWRDAYGGPR